jgi:hypothetical protein
MLIQSLELVSTAKDNLGYYFVVSDVRNIQKRILLQYLAKWAAGPLAALFSEDLHPG